MIFLSHSTVVFALAGLNALSTSETLHLSEVPKVPGETSVVLRVTQALLSFGQQPPKKVFTFFPGGLRPPEPPLSLPGGL